MSRWQLAHKQPNRQVERDHHLSFRVFHRRTCLELFVDKVTLVANVGTRPRSLRRTVRAQTGRGDNKRSDFTRTFSWIVVQTSEHLRAYVFHVSARHKMSNYYIIWPSYVVVAVAAAAMVREKNHSLGE